MTFRWKVILGLCVAFWFWAQALVIYLNRACYFFGAMEAAKTVRIAFLIKFIMLIYFRYSHAGQVAAGALCTKLVDGSCKNSENYLKNTSFLVTCFICSIGFITVVVILKMFVYDGKPISNLDLPLHKDYLLKYERVGEKPLGVGQCGAAWKVKVKGGKDDVLFVGKEVCN
jgi:hypothetical protein